MKKKKILKIAAFVVAAVLTVSLAFFANALVGNPVSRLLAKNSTQKHLELNYSDKDFTTERITYDFKSGCYHAFIVSSSSPDSSFSISLGFDGKVLWDSYEDRVLRRWNTSERINKEYREAVDKVFDSTTFPYKTHISFGDIEFVEKINLDQPYIPDYAVVIDDLELDGYYDIGELGKKAGRLTAYIYDNEVTEAKLAEILIGIKATMNASGIEFRVIDCVLEPPKGENGYEGGYTGDERVEVNGFACDDIYEEGMSERVKKAVDETKALRELQDSEKQKELEAYIEASKEAG